MIDPKLLDDLAKRLSASVPTGLQSLQQDEHKNLHSALEAGLSQLDLQRRVQVLVFVLLQGLQAGRHACRQSLCQVVQ